MVAHQTLTLFVRVRILHPLPQKPLELTVSGVFCAHLTLTLTLTGFLEVFNILLHPVGAVLLHAL